MEYTHGGLRPATGEEIGELFECVWRSWARRLGGRVALPAAAVEEALATAFLRALEKRPPRARLEGWIYLTAKREALAARRAAAREPVTDQPPEWLAPEEVSEARELLELLRWLKPQQRQVLALRIEGYGYREICARLGRSHTWVNRHLTEGRAALRRLREEGPPVGGEPSSAPPFRGHAT